VREIYFFVGATPAARRWKSGSISGLLVIGYWFLFLGRLPLVLHAAQLISDVKSKAVR